MLRSAFVLAFGLASCSSQPDDTAEARSEESPAPVQDLINTSTSAPAPVNTVDPKDDSASGDLDQAKSDPADTGQDDISEGDTDRRESDGVEAGEPAAVDGLTFRGPSVPPEGVWRVLQRRFFVFGVAADDRLNIRSGPGVTHKIIGSFSPATTGIELYDEVVYVGSGDNKTAWSPVKVSDGAGWIGRRFIRPMPNTPIEVRGKPHDIALIEAAAVAELLGSPASLAALIGPGGLRFSTDAYLDDSDVVLGIEDLQTNAKEPFQWGTHDGTGDPIVRSLGEHLEHLGGLTALTSTEVVSVDFEIGRSNTINNISSFYPGALVVEYHFAGTEYYGGLDWSSIRFVFDFDEAEVLRLIAIVEAQWTI